MFFAYLYKDPKNGIHRYVGKGQHRRSHDHLKRSSNLQLDRMIKKRLIQGYKLEPQIIPAKDESDAFEIEMLLIKMIGRKDLNEGPLFNQTDGGETSVGRKAPDAERAQNSRNKKNFYRQPGKLEALAKVTKTRWDDPHGRRVFVEALNRADVKAKMKAAKSRSCTIDDGVTIFLLSSK
jgi:hypothetical protein